MDTELVALASSGASTLVTLMMTDAWEQAKQAVAALFARSSPEAAPVIESQLEESRRDLMAARDSDDDLTEEELIVEWRGRLRRLLATDSETAKELQAIIDQFDGSTLQPTMHTKSIKMNAKATGLGTVYQQGQGVQHNR